MCAFFGEIATSGFSSGRYFESDPDLCLEKPLQSYMEFLFKQMQSPVPN